MFNSQVIMKIKHFSEICVNLNDFPTIILIDNNYRYFITAQ